MWGNKRQANGAGEDQSNTKKYQSKLRNLLLESDSEEDDHSTQGYEQRQMPPPLVSNRAERSKENSSYVSNKAPKEIKYASYKVYGEKLFQIPNAYQNSINLEEASIIKDTNEALQSQLEKTKKEFYEQICQFQGTIKQLQNENKNLRTQLRLVTTQQDQKQQYYQGLQEQLQSKTREIEKLQKKIKSLETEKTQVSRAKISKPKRQSELSKYLSTPSKQPQEQVFPRKHDSSYEETYAQITKYIVKRIEELKDSLCQQRMSPLVESIIDQFMTEIVNINPITVSKCNRAFTCHSPINKLNRLHSQNQQNAVNSRTPNIKFSSSAMMKTPVTPVRAENKQKSESLVNLEKSIQKLKQMEKSFVSNNTKQNFESLDRSSVMGLDRSKSRRKKIFQ